MSRGCALPPYKASSCSVRVIAYQPAGRCKASAFRQSRFCGWCTRRRRGGTSATCAARLIVPHSRGLGGGGSGGEGQRGGHTPPRPPTGACRVAASRRGTPPRASAVAGRAGPIRVRLVAKRQAAASLEQTDAVSARHACRVGALPRRPPRRQPGQRAQIELAQRMQTRAERAPRFG